MWDKRTAYNLSLSSPRDSKSLLASHLRYVLTQLHIKGILGIGHDIDTNLSLWYAKCLAGVTRLTWRTSRCTALVVATVTLRTSGREHLNNSTVYRRTYNDARAHTPRLWPLLTASWRSLGNVEWEKERDKDGEETEGGRAKVGKKAEREKDLSCPFSCTVKVDVLFSTRRLSRRVLYGDRLRAANGTETRSNATARWTVRIEIWSRGEWCYGSILYKWYVSVILFGRLEKDRSHESLLFRADVFARELRNIIFRNDFYTNITYTTQNDDLSGREIISLFHS